MKFGIISTFLLLLCASELLARDVDRRSRVVDVRVSGYLGDRIDACIEHRVKAQDVNHLVEPFRHRTETSRWQSEFWGKWVLGAIDSYRYCPDPVLLEKIVSSVNGILETQSEDGYIGNYSPEAQLTQWDIWGRKYTLLGLLAYYDLSGEKRVLKACGRLADHLLTQVGPEAVNIVKTGNYRGMPSSSILEPIVYLYRRTGEKRYLDFARYIVDRWETPDGPGLIRKAIDGVNVWERFPYPKTWWSWENGHKAYEMMSCYEGLLELYRETEDPLYLQAVEQAVNNIIDQEINAAGSGSAFECWYGGRAKQTQPTYHTMETCVTFTWIKLCNTLLRMTGKSCYADQIERSVYNALLASFKQDASQIAKYSPLEGCRHPGEEQCGMHINCCNANGPRAFALIPQMIYQVSDNRISVQLYAAGEAVVALTSKQHVRVVQETDYPASGKVVLTVYPEKDKSLNFDLVLRIPEWCKETSIFVNGEQQSAFVDRGYIVLSRRWKTGDRVMLILDMQARLIEQDRMQAIVRGPILLARDSRFRDGDVDETIVIPTKDGCVALEPVKTGNDFAWLSFAVQGVLGTDLEGETAHRTIHFCDFGSAGNSWDMKERYRVWLPKTLNVMTTPYSRY